MSTPCLSITCCTFRTVISGRDTVVLMILLDCLTYNCLIRDKLSHSSIRNNWLDNLSSPVGTTREQNEGKTTLACFTQLHLQSSWHGYHIPLNRFPHLNSSIYCPNLFTCLTRLWHSELFCSGSARVIEEVVLLACYCFNMWNNGQPSTDDHLSWGR